MKSINVGILLCLLTVGAASFFVFSQNTTSIATELKVGEPIESVLVPDQISELGLLGKNIFELKCQSCHGINAAGRYEMGPPLVHKIYEPSHHSYQIDCILDDCQSFKTKEIHFQHSEIC